MSSGSMKGQKSERGKFDATFAYFNDMRLFKQTVHRYVWSYHVLCQDPRYF